MARELLEVGDQLHSIREQGLSPLMVGKHGVASITVNRLAGPMGWYVVAVVKRDNGTEQILPLHMLLEVQIGHG